MTFTCNLVLGCEVGHEGSSTSITLPGPFLQVPADDTIVKEVRGCVFDGANELGPVPINEGLLMIVAADIRSNSMGTAVITVPPDEDHHISNFPDRMNAEAVMVPPERDAHLEEDFIFSGLGAYMENISSGRDGRCSEWMSVEFTWEEVGGSDPLLVEWQVLFAPQPEVDVTLGIDFRPDE